MKSSFWSLFIFSTAMLGYSCTVSTHVDKANSANLSDYKTYMWVNAMANKADSSDRPTAFADISIHNAANHELQRWSWREVAESPDLFISYDILVEKSVETESDALYSQPYNRVYYNRFSKRWSSIYYPPQLFGYQQYQVPVKDATIILTMIDARTDKQVWVGWTSERLGSSGITDLNTKRAIKNIFKKANKS
jgi:uncharacterized protein DUF4136